MPGYNPNPHQLSAAQIENRKYSIFIKNLVFEEGDVEDMKQSMKEDLCEFGHITTLTVDANRKTAFVRFRRIYEAENAAARSNEVNPETGTKIPLLREPNDQALILYVIPEISKEELMKREAASKNEVYDPLKDNKLTLDQVCMYIR